MPRAVTCPGARPHRARAASPRRQPRARVDGAGGIPPDRPATAAGTASRQAFPEPGVGAGLVHHAAKLLNLGPERGPAPVRELVVTALGFLPVPGLGAPGFRDQAALFEPLYRLVQRARTEPDLAVAPSFDILFDGIPVLRSSGQSEHDVENGE